MRALTHTQARQAFVAAVRIMNSRGQRYQRDDGRVPEGQEAEAVVWEAALAAAAAPWDVQRQSGGGSRAQLAPANAQPALNSDHQLHATFDC